MGIGEDPDPIADTLGQRFQIQGLQRALGLQVLAVMGHPQLAFHQIHVGLDAAESMIESLQQRPLLLVIVVGMSLNQRSHLRRR